MLLLIVRTYCGLRLYHFYNCLSLLPKLRTLIKQQNIAVRKQLLNSVSIYACFLFPDGTVEQDDGIEVPYTIDAIHSGKEQRCNISDAVTTSHQHSISISRCMYRIVPVSLLNERANSF